jgi:hypothetical protein
LPHGMISLATDLFCNLKNWSKTDSLRSTGTLL